MKADCRTGSLNIGDLEMKEGKLPKTAKVFTFETKREGKEQRKRMDVEKNGADGGKMGWMDRWMEGGVDAFMF